MTRAEKHEIADRVARLSLADQLAVIEELVRGLRRALPVDPALEREMEREVDAMMADPGMQRVLRNEDLGDPHGAG